MLPIGMRWLRNSSLLSAGAVTVPERGKIPFVSYWFTLTSVALLLPCFFPGGSLTPDFSSLICEPLTISGIATGMAVTTSS